MSIHKNSREFPREFCEWRIPGESPEIPGEFPEIPGEFPEIPGEFPEIPELREFPVAEFPVALLDWPIIIIIDGYPEAGRRPLFPSKVDNFNTKINKN